MAVYVSCRKIVTGEIMGNKNKLKIDGILSFYLKWPFILSALLIIMNITIYVINRRAGAVVTVFVAVYISFKLTKSVARLKFRLDKFGTEQVKAALATPPNDELALLEESYDQMVLRVEDLIEKNNIKIDYFVMPSIEAIDKFYESMLYRGNSREYINERKSKYMKHFNRHKNKKETIFLNEGENLETVLKQLGIL